MSMYKHGTYGEFAASVGRIAAQAGTTAVYVGAAPVNLVRGYADAGIINVPVKLGSMVDVQNKMGYSAAWDSFSLCEAFKAHFDNAAGSIGPIVAINVLDPDKHRSAEQTAVELTFANGRATILSNTIILDTLVLTGKEEGTDYSVSYNHSAGKVIIDSVGSEKLTGTVSATFSTVDPAAVTAEEVIGFANDGVYSGFGVVSLVNQTLGLIPNIIAAPGWSHIPAVYEAMISAATKINGHWDAVVIADIPLSDASGAVDTISKAKTWKNDNGYISERAKVCWPKGRDIYGNIYHISTATVWEMLRTDATHDGIPMETPSNKPTFIAKQYFGEGSKNAGFDQNSGNELNADGITTVVFWGGRWVLWGPHTAAYKHGMVSDNRVIFDNSIRMMMHISNSFQSDWATEIDSPMTRAMADTIKNREQEKADALSAMGAIIGTPIVRFVSAGASEAEIVEGNFEWSFEGTPTPPWKAGTMRVAYSTDGFATYLGEEE